MAWKVEKLFQVEGGDIIRLAAENTTSVFFRTVDCIYHWNSQTCQKIWSSSAGWLLSAYRFIQPRVFEDSIDWSLSWDHAEQILYFDKYYLFAFNPKTSQVSQIGVSTEINQFAAFNGHLIMLKRGILGVEMLSITLGMEIYSVKERKRIGKRRSAESLVIGTNCIGIVADEKIVYYDPETMQESNSKNLNIHNRGESCIVENNDGDALTVIRREVWLLKDGKRQRIISQELQNVRHLSVDQQGNFYAASMDSVWKITKLPIANVSDQPGQWKRLKLFLVGDGGAGKTSTLRWLMGKPFSEIPSRTDGAEVTTTELRSWKETSLDIKEYMAHTLHQSLQSEKKRTPMIKLEQVAELKVQPNTGKDEPIPEARSFHHPSTNQNDNLSLQPNAPVAPLVVPDELMDSIDEYQDRRLNDELPMTFHIWDFGGQEVYYNTHHFFLTEAAIYLLVMDLTQSTSTMISRLQFWLHSIRSYSPEAPVVVIGTRKDSISEQEVNSKLECIWDEAQKFQNPPTNRHVIAINCKRDNDLRVQTQQLLVELAQNETAKRKISFRYMLFFHALEQASATVKTTLKCLTFSQAMDEAANCGMNEEEMLRALKCFHDLGFLMYYAGHDLLKDTIFMQPTQLVNVLKAVVTITHTEALPQRNNIQFGPSAQKAVHRHSIVNEEVEAIKKGGRVTTEKLATVWSLYTDMIPRLRSLMQQFGLAVPDPNQKDTPENQRDLIVPCLVQIEMSGIPVLQQWFTNPQTIKLKLKGITQPLGLVSRIIVKALLLAQKTEESVPACVLFKGGCAFSYFGMYVRLITSTGKIKIHLQYPKLNQMAFEIEVAKKVLKELRELLKDVPCTEHITCFKCRKALCDKPQTFTCHYCQITALNTKTTDTRNNGPGIALIKQDEWKSLGLLLDNNGHWRMLGDKLGKSVFELDDIERRGKESSPTKILLTEWLSEIDAHVMDTLITALKDINNVDAAALLQNLTSSNHN